MVVLWIVIVVSIFVALYYLQNRKVPGRPPVVSGYGSIPVLSPLIAVATNPRDLFIYCGKKYEEEGIARVSFFNLINLNIVFGLPCVEAFFKAPESDLSLGQASQFAVGPLLGTKPKPKFKIGESEDYNTSNIKEAIMKSDQVKYMMQKAEKITEKYSSSMDTTKDKDLFKELYNLIVTINIHCFVGDDVEDFSKEMTELLWKIENYGTNVRSIFNPYSAHRKISVNARLRLVEIMSVLRNRRVQAIKDGTYQPDVGGRDVLQVNIDMGKTDEEIVSALLGIFFAAQTNTVSTTCWTIAYLATWKEWQERARKEVIEKFGTDGKPTIEDLRKLNTLGACLSETVRKNAVAFLFRKATKNLKLEKFNLVKGDYVVVSPSVLHSNEKVFPEADKWKPERFVSGDDDYNTVANQKFGKNFVQWGFYSHRCLGEHFANMVMRVILVKLLQRYEMDIDVLSGLDYTKALGMPFALDKIDLKLTPINK